MVSLLESTLSKPLIDELAGTEILRVIKDPDSSPSSHGLEIDTLISYVVTKTVLLNAFIGDDGTGGAKGVVPAPEAGDASANKLLHADGSWKTPDDIGLAQAASELGDDNRVLRSDGTGRGVQASPVIMDDNGRMILTGITGSSGMNVSTPGLGEFEVRAAAGGAAMINFHRVGLYAAYFGIDTDNQLKIGGWSHGANAYKIWHENNDGSGSGLDADTLDGLQATSFAQLSTSNLFSGAMQINGTVGIGRPGSGLSGVYLNRDPDNPFIMFSYGSAGSPSDIAQIRASGSGGFIGITEPAGSYRFQVNRNTGAVQFNTYGAGTLVTDSSGNITASSDERLKDDIEPWGTGLAAILQIQPIEYSWTEASGLDRMNRYVGFSAQNVDGALPDAVGMGADGYLTLQDRPILAALVNAVKELAVESATLAARITALETAP